jgi:tetratricopeptide (TPR) repeat protein/RNA polymerase subunit RPABC4/transcription elongation factor Spt4
MSLVQCPECHSKVSSNTGMCLNCGFPISKAEALVELGDLDLNPLMIAYQSPIARESEFLPQPKPKPAPIKIVEESSDPTYDGLNCLQCGGGITPDDIKCPQCKTLIMRRYCSHCSRLIPDHATICPLCNKNVKEHFSYSKLRRTKILIAAGTAAAFIFLIIVLILQQPQAKTTQAQADAAPKREIHAPPPPAKVPEPEIKQTKEPDIQQKEVKTPEPPVIHEIVPPPTATRSVEVPREIQKPKVVAKEVQPPKELATVEEPQKLAKAEEPKLPTVDEPEKLQKEEEVKQVAKVRTPPVRPMLSPALQRTADLKSQQRVVKARSLNHRGYSLIKNGRPHDAIPLLEQAVRSFPESTHDLNYAYALFNLAVAYRMAGKPERAIPLLEERIKINDQRDVVARELLSAKREAKLSDFN